MRLQKLGHSCLLIEHEGRRILVDPGNLSDAWHGLTGLDAVLITHQHPDHLDLAAFPALVEANAGVEVVADQGAADELRGLGIEAVVAHSGNTVDVADLAITAFGTAHAVIHPDIPRITNTGYLIGELFVPGDAFTVPPAEAGVRVLAVPLTAPWSKAEETIDYVRAVGAAVVVPVHDAILAPVGVALFHRLVGQAAPSSTLRPLDGERSPVEV